MTVFSRLVNGVVAPVQITNSSFSIHICQPVALKCITSWMRMLISDASQIYNPEYKVLFLD